MMFERTFSTSAPYTSATKDLASCIILASAGLQILLSSLSRKKLYYLASVNLNEGNYV